MKIQKVQSNQTTFGVTVKFAPKTTELLRKKGSGIYFTYFCSANDLMHWEKDNGVMVISHMRQPHKKANIVANLYVQDGDKTLVSQTPVQEPIYSVKKDGSRYIADLRRMYDNLKNNLVELTELRYSYKFFEKNKK